MRVVVPALHADNVATRCLSAEHVEHEVHVLKGPNDYAQLLAKLWRDGEGFVVVEDDIAPYPGAIKALENCTHYWCGYFYCLPGRWDVEEDDQHSELFGTNGCFKVSTEVIQAMPELYERWDKHEWQLVDVAVTAALRHALWLEGGPSTFHVHQPPVAHAMHYRPETKHVREQDRSQAVGHQVG